MKVLKAVDEKLEEIVKKAGYSELSNFVVNSNLEKLKKEVELKLFSNIGNDEKKILFSRVKLMDEICHLTAEEKVEKFIL